MNLSRADLREVGLVFSIFWAFSAILVVGDAVSYPYQEVVEAVCYLGIGLCISAGLLFVVHKILLAVDSWLEGRQAS